MNAVLQRKCACGGKCDDCAKKQNLQRRQSNGPEPNRVPAVVHQVLGSQGQPLDSALRRTMESRFRHNFADVRIHRDQRAAESAQAVNADAWTIGRHIAFQPHLYAPETPAGQRLIAHELAHVTQQRHASSNAPLTIGDPHAPAEAEADRAADAAVGGAIPAPLAPTPTGLRRQPSGYKLPPNPDLQLKLDPTLTAAFLARCQMGEGDFKLCAQIRAMAMGQPLPPSSEPAPDLSPNSPTMKAILADINKPPIFPPGGPGQKPLPPAPGPAPDTDSGPDLPDLSGVKKAIEKVTKFEFRFGHTVINVSLPTEVVAQIRPIANARNVVFSVKAEVTGAFTASMSIDREMPISLSAKVDAADKTFTASLTLDSGRGDCEAKIPADAISKVQDAATKISALFTKADPNAAKPVTQPEPIGPPKAPEPPKTGIEKTVGDVVDKVKAEVAKVQDQIDQGKAIAAFVDAMNAIKDQQKDKCKKTRWQVGAFGQFPLGDQDRNTPTGASSVGLGLKVYF